MPLGKKSPLELPVAPTALVFDTFVAVSRGTPTFVHWAGANLPADDTATITRLAENLTTLGRAEGWVHAELAQAGMPHCNCGPSAVADTDQELVSVFCPDPLTAFDDAHYPPLPGPRELKKGLKAHDFLFDCPRWHLCLDTEIIQKARWPRVPGARWVSYARPAAAFTDAPEVHIPRPARRPQARVARYLLDAPVLPQVTDTLPLAEDARKELLRQCARVLRQQGLEAAWPTVCEGCPGLTGKEPDGTRLRGHGHAYYLPADEDGDGRIDHLAIVAAHGFTADEVRALDRFRQIPHGDGEPLRLLLIGLGTERDLASPLFGPSANWLSATPYLACRYPKRRGTKRDRPEHYATSQVFAAHVLREELDRLRQTRPELPAVLAVEPVDCLRGPGQLRPIQFARFRRKHGDDGGRRPNGAFRIVFAGPATGPLCLGHAAHFGLGLFLPPAP
jgi:CRISPR-associated protein Csb2